MLFSSKVKLEDLIIEVLALKPGQTPKEIHSLLSKAKSSYNLSSVYQELRKLKSVGILVHKENTYQLRLGWVNDLSKLFREVEKNYLKSDNLHYLFPDISEKVQIDFKDLKSLCVYWGQIIIGLAMKNQSQRFYEWAPYCWFDFSDVGEENQFREILLKKKLAYYLVIGHQSHSNKMVRESLDGVPGAVLDSVPAFSIEDNVYYSISSPYLLTVEISPIIHNQIANLMDAAENFRDINQFKLAFNQILLEEGKCTLSIEHNLNKVKKLTIKFNQLFGI